MKCATPWPGIHCAPGPSRTKPDAAAASARVLKNRERPTRAGADATRPHAADYSPVALSADVPPGELLSVRLPRRAGRAHERGRRRDVRITLDCCSRESFALSRPASSCLDGTIECVRHGARFDCRTGAATACTGSRWCGGVRGARVEHGTIFVGPRRPRHDAKVLSSCCSCVTQGCATWIRRGHGAQAGCGARRGARVLARRVTQTPSGGLCSGSVRATER